MKFILFCILLASFGCKKRQTAQNLQSTAELEKTCDQKIPTEEDLFLEMNHDPQPSDESVEKEVQKLGDDIYATREEGSKNLMQMNDLVLKATPFKNALLSSDPEVVVRATAISNQKLQAYNPPTDAEIGGILTSTLTNELKNLVLRKKPITPEAMEFRQLVKNMFQENIQVFNAVASDDSLYKSSAIKLFQNFRATIAKANFEIFYGSSFKNDESLRFPTLYLSYVKNNVIIQNSFALYASDYWISTPSDTHLTTDKFVIPDKKIKNIFRFNKAFCKVNSIVLAQEGLQISRTYESNRWKWTLLNTLKILLVSSSEGILGAISIADPLTYNPDGTSFVDEAKLPNSIDSLSRNITKLLNGDNLTHY